MYGSIAGALLILVVLVVAIPLVLILVLNSVGTAVSNNRKSPHGPEMDKETIKVLTEAGQRNPNPPPPLLRQPPPPPSAGLLPPPQGSPIGQSLISSGRTDNGAIIGAYFGAVALVICASVAIVVVSAALK